MAIDKDLSAPLDPRRVQSREGSGGKRLPYLTTHDVKRTANRIFGFDGWNYVVDDLISLGEEPFKNRNGKEGIRVGYRAVVTVTVGDVRRGDVGYGDAQEYNQSRITPHELASKEAVSDALKRCLSSWGDQFGLVLYGADPAPEPVEESPAASLPSSATADAAGDEHKRATETKSTITLREPDQEFITDGQFKKLGEIAGPKGYKMSGDQFRDVVEEAIGTRDARKIKRYQFDAVLKAVDFWEGDRGMTDFDRLEMQTLQDDADWRERTEWQAEVNAGQLKLEADMLAQTEIDYKAGADSPAGATDSRANPPARARESLPVKQRLLVDSLEQSALFYERHGKLRAAEVAREMADKARHG